MTPDDARQFADGIQQRVDQMGDRTGEGQYLGQCLSVIRDLAAQIDAKAARALVSEGTGGRGADVPVEKSKKVKAADSHLGGAGGE